MFRYLARRSVSFVPILFGISILVFLAIRLVPGDAIKAMLGTEAGMLTPTQRASLEAYFGLDKPVGEQYLHWLVSALQGDFGTSVRQSAPVLQVILQRFPATLELTLLGTFLALLIGLPIGTLSALYHNSTIDIFGRLLALLGLAMPSFLLGTLLIYVLSVYFGILPNSGNYVDFLANPTGNLEQMVFPAITLGFPFAASIMRTTRSAMLEVLGQDYVRTARSKGLGERVITLRHVARNALIPVVTITGIEMGYLLGGTVIVEEIFAIPGIGWLTLNAILQRDYALIQGVTLFIAVNFVVINLLVDLIYTLIDPRISYDARS